MLTKANDALVIGRDIRFSFSNQNKAFVAFSVLDLQNVRAFLANDERVKFLTDPLSDDKNQSGRRLNINLLNCTDGLKFIVGRNLGTNTIAQAAYYDLLQAVNSYITPYDSSNEMSVADWSDMLRGQQSVSVDKPGDRPSYPRGKKFLVSAEVKDVSLDQDDMQSRFIRLRSTKDY